MVLKERITTAIKSILEADYGFDVYVSMKSGDLFKRFVLEEGRPEDPNGFKNRIRNSVVETIRNRFLSEESQFASGDDLANEQNCFYVIKQDDAYQPFRYLCIPDEQITNFSLEDKNNADALLFKFILQRSGVVKILWGYQKIQPSAIPNKKRNHFQLKAKSQERPDVFEELTDQMFIITKNIDLLVIGDEIITDKIALMERHLRLETFVRASGRRAVEAITTLQLIKNEDKLLEYIQRPNKKYAKKMMQIHKFPVASMNKTDLMTQLYTVERWKNVFEIQDDQICLRRFSDVEQMIDLFTERYTRSDVTGQEYDTSVKNMAEPVEDAVGNP